MFAGVLKGVLKGIKVAKREAQETKTDGLSHWRYKDLVSTVYLHPPDYLWNLAKDAVKRRHIDDLNAIVQHITGHGAEEGNFGDILQYITKSTQRIESKQASK